MSSTETDDLPKEGELLAEKYRVERVLGQGGMGVVIAAQHLALRQTVAIKLLLPEAMERADAVERFLREGRAARSITSEHIARVHDVGTLESGRPYMVMEYLVGADLGDLLDRQGALTVGEAVDYILQACEAIAEAHKLGIVHRDLKPANLFVTRRPDGTPLVKVLDFGLSKLTKTDALEPSLTSANTVMGSPYYMSPEQVRSLKSIDARADIWALGVILYQLVTNRRPFNEESLGALFVQIGAEPPVPIRDHAPGIPDELEAIISKCLEKAPANRFQSVAELTRALAPLASEGARVSIERILRTLDDHAPLAARPALGSLPEIERPSGPQVQIVPPGPTAIPKGRASTPPAAATLDARAQPPSQSNPALASSLLATGPDGASRTGRHDMGPGSRAMVYVMGIALALVGGAAAALLIVRPDPGANGTNAANGPATALTATATAAEPTAPTVSPAPPPTASVSASATASVSASATASVSASATTSASASVSAASAAAAAPSSTTGKKPFTAPKKKADPLDRK